MDIIQGSPQNTNHARILGYNTRILNTGSGSAVAFSILGPDMAMVPSVPKLINSEPLSCFAARGCQIHCPPLLSVIS